MKLRDKRELFRTRMVLSHQRTSIKNRIHSSLDKYGIRITNTSDIFNIKGRDSITKHLKDLPDQTRFSTIQLLEKLDYIQEKIKLFQDRMSEAFAENPDVKLLKTIPGIGPILSVVIISEIGNISRFPSAEHLASYSGTTPSIHASGGKYRYGRAPADRNKYLKWAFAEAANTVMKRRKTLPYLHVSTLYERVRSKRGHSVAIGAVLRHLAESTYWVLTKKENYKEPLHKENVVLSRNE